MTEHVPNLVSHVGIVLISVDRVRYALLMVCLATGECCGITHCLLGERYCHNECRLQCMCCDDSGMCSKPGERCCGFGPVCLGTRRCCPNNTCGHFCPDGTCRECCQDLDCLLDPCCNNSCCGNGRKMLYRRYV